MQGTVGAGDTFVVPAGRMYFESIGSKDFAGVKRTILSMKDLEQLTQLRTFLVAIGASNSTLQGAIDCLALLE